MIDIKYSTKQIDQLLGSNKKVEKAIYKASKRSINDVASRIRTRSVKRLAKENSLVHKVVRKNIVLSKAWQPYLASLQATVWPRYLGMEAYAYPKKYPKVKVMQSFGPNKIKKQVKRKGVKIKVKGEFKLVKHGFLAQMKSGHRGLFIKRKPDYKRKPIDEIYSSSIADLFENIKPEIEREAVKEMDKIFKHHLDFYKKKLDGAGS